jgi:hypothetical protein
MDNDEGGLNRAQASSLDVVDGYRPEQIRWWIGRNMQCEVLCSVQPVAIRIVVSGEVCLAESRQRGLRWR